MKTNVSWNKVLEPLGYRGPKSDIMHGQGSNPRAGWTFSIGQKVMTYITSLESDVVPRKRKFGVSFSPVSFLFFFSSGSLRVFLLTEVLWAVLFLSVFTISILALFPFLCHSSPFTLSIFTCCLSFLTCSVFLSVPLSLPHVPLAQSSGHPPLLPCGLFMILLSFISSLCSSASFFLLFLFFLITLFLNCIFFFFHFTASSFIYFVWQNSSWNLYKAATIQFRLLV